MFTTLHTTWILTILQYNAKIKYYDCILILLKHIALVDILCNVYALTGVPCLYSSEILNNFPFLYNVLETQQGAVKQTVLEIIHVFC